MYNVSAYDSNSISTLFSSLSTSRGKNTGSVNFGIDLSTYSMIKSGSYGKLMKSYYSSEGANSAVDSIASTSTSKDSSKTLTQIKGSAEDLKESASALYKSGSDTFKTDANGEYDRDKIYKAVEAFVDDYNSAVKAASKTNTTSIANSAASMVNYTKNNANMLSKLGITMSSSDYTISLDKDTFEKADMSAIKSAFSGNGSYAYSIAVKASMIESNATAEAAKSNTYNSSGSYTYNYSTGELFSSNI